MIFISRFIKQYFSLSRYLRIRYALYLNNVKRHLTIYLKHFNNIYFVLVVYSMALKYE